MKAVTLLLALATFGAQANHEHEESHSHGAHEHGHGLLNFVVDGNQLMIELQAPAADLVGFEHAATTAEEKAQYAKALAQLKQPETLFGIAPAAACQLAHQEIKAPQPEEDHEGHDHDAAHDEDHANHDHDAAHEHDGHADLGAIYTYNCTALDQLSGLTAKLFSVYPSLSKLTVQGILPSGQTAAELTPTANTVNW
ncbi:DUF2796 domain-containing protein [Aeromonas sp. BIGb0445]|uniref:DUF2796 domain-containing protein n=1 Tax=Aeromonas sp. BIGb0445 TaxID=2940593 RepID=UPI002169A21C|nr:DUF2796 domain-containing protein [Aeromonas sp. BIGb0445]MCS3461452.1 hypothetical protein [Aeromonas sp. BIGb0445]